MRDIKQKLSNLVNKFNTAKGKTPERVERMKKVAEEAKKLKKKS